MKEKVDPLFLIPESNKPVVWPGVPEVALWSLSAQVHFTVSPGWIETFAGEKVRVPAGATVTETVAAGAG